LNVCETGAAAAYLLLPACEAVIVQVPAAKNEIVPAETVHTLVVEEVKVTGRPEVAVTLSSTGVPTV
jgi:hypothetical protein